MRRALRILGREAHAVARQGQLMLMSDRKNDFARPRGSRVVAFVHGYGAAGAVFGPLREHVHRRLGLATAELTYRSSESFMEIAERLAKSLDALAEHGRVDLVGHSLGGLLSRWYLQELGGADKVDRLVTMATPHAGTRSAKVAVGPLRSALLPESAVVRRLSMSRERAANVAHLALVAGADLMVTPPSSAAAIEGAEVRWFPDLGHNAMLFDAEVHDVIADALSER